jgi:hypothetical protein
MRFAILTHDHPFPHWDLLLQCGETCRTWRLLAAPDSPGPISAEPIPDHRVLYLEYEGPVSSDRGTVTRWDGGPLVWVTARADRVRVIVSGHQWQGIVVLQQTDNGWVCERHMAQKFG